jgi:uncharacterized membrane protein YcaP (DUF421 family)
MWVGLFGEQIPLWEKVVRTVAVYAGLAVLLRLAGKRELAQLNSFDLVVVLLLSNVVQNAVIGPDNSLSGGLIGAGVLVAVNALVVRIANRHPRLNRLFEGRPTVLVRHGKVQGDLHRLGLRRADVAAALRRQGADNLAEIKEATLAPGGTIELELEPAAKNATVQDVEQSTHILVAELRSQIDALSAQLAAVAAQVQRPAGGETGEPGNSKENDPDQGENHKP